MAQNFYQDIVFFFVKNKWEDVGKKINEKINLIDKINDRKNKLKVQRSNASKNTKGKKNENASKLQDYYLQCGLFHGNRKITLLFYVKYTKL